MVDKETRNIFSLCPDFESIARVILDGFKLPGKCRIAFFAGDVTLVLPKPKPTHGCDKDNSCSNRDSRSQCIHHFSILPTRFLSKHLPIARVCSHEQGPAVDSISQGTEA